MKIQFCSDLHIEFPENRSFLDKKPIPPLGDILILAGDIGYLQKKFYKNPIFDYFSQNFKQVFWLPGNHEYYNNHDINSFGNNMNKPIRDNVFIVNNVAFKYESVNFIFSTLWSYIHPVNEIACIKTIADFHLIRYEGHTLLPANFNELYNQSFNFVKKALEEVDSQPTVVVTHHLPSRLCNVPEFDGTPVNDGFCVDLTEFIASCNADYWIYGHSHRNLPDFTIGKTTLVTNQFGYVGYDEHLDFRHDAVITINN